MPIIDQWEYSMIGRSIGLLSQIYMFAEQNIGGYVVLSGEEGVPLIEEILDGQEVRKFLAKFPSFEFLPDTLRKSIVSFFY